MEMEEGMPREEMIRQIREALEEADEYTLQQIFEFIMAAEL